MYLTFVHEMDISRLIFLLALYVIDVSEAASSPPPCVPDTSHKDSWRKEDFPNPQINIDKCGRNCKKSWICDPSHILSRQSGDELDELIERVSRSGTCSCSECSYPDGYNIAVALVPSMSYFGSDAKAAAQSFAYYLRVNWDFEECDNNVVIFVSRDDRKEQKKTNHSDIFGKRFEIAKTVSVGKNGGESAIFKVTGN
ncbi:uncharacterized protein [Mytilus edulis]|uniref:uncharacterized protein n=1 Tax=Mytilus edulis TaxID=6550 RepID=UPI0039EEEFFA